MPTTICCRCILLDLSKSQPTVGAFAGLQQLGFNLSWEAKGKKKNEILLPWIKSAFQCVYDHLDMHLTDLDKKELRFGVIFVEHLLYKVGRWESRFRKNSTTSLVSIGWNAQLSSLPWVPGANFTDNTGLAFPIPLTSCMDEVAASILKSKS